MARRERRRDNGEARSESSPRSVGHDAMTLLASIPGNGPAGLSGALATLGVAILFGAIFLHVRRAGYAPGAGVLSFAAGISLAYTFVHVIPGLHRIREIHIRSPAEFGRLVPEYSVYLWSMAGFLAFFGLDVLAARSGADAPGAWRPRLEIGGFVLYVFLLAYLLVWTEKPMVALAFYAVAMGMHLLPVAWNLRSHFPALYPRGALLLAAGSLAGWAASFARILPAPVVLDLVAFVAGGVIVNAAVTELHREKEGRFGFFVGGALAYTALLLALSRFE